MKHDIEALAEAFDHDQVITLTPAQEYSAMMAARRYAEHMQDKGAIGHLRSLFAILDDGEMLDSLGNDEASKVNAAYDYLQSLEKPE